MKQCFLQLLRWKETNAVTVQERDVCFEICSGVWAAFINCTPSLSEKDADVKGWILGFGGSSLCRERSRKYSEKSGDGEKGAENCMGQALLCPQSCSPLVGFWFCSEKRSLSVCFK